MKKMYTPFRTLVLFILALFTTTLAFAQPDADAGSVPHKDQVIADDLIVDGSACIGFDCVNGESFGFDTLRLKENNLRIRAFDTSSTASFPSRDWQITFNDTTNGGQNKFSIDDIDGGRTPFTIEAGAPSHSLYVEDGGRIGLGTNIPVVEIHVKDGDTPTLRLEQDGSSGFTPQTWDLAGNETNFFVRDVTSGSTLPFRIRPGAPTSALDIAGSGDIGMGTSSPSSALHVRRTGGTAALLVESTNATGAAQMTALSSGEDVLLLLENTNASAQQVDIRMKNISGEYNQQVRVGGAAGDFRLRSVTGTTDIFQVDQSDAYHVTFPGEVTVTGMFNNSDLRLKSNVKSMTDGLNVIMQLNPISYSFNNELKLNTNRTHVGIAAQELQKVAPYLVANGEHFVDGPDGQTTTKNFLKIDALAIKWLLVNSIKEQQAQIDEKELRIDALEQELTQLSALSQEVETLKGQIEKLSELIATNNAQDVFLYGSKAQLGQNFPNPYSESTVIEYYLPKDVQSAEIQFFDMAGKLLRVVPIEQTGKGQINLEAKDLPNGNYNYSLVINGRAHDTKKMILSK